MFPIKSCRVVSVDEIEARRSGTVGDRELMLVHDGKLQGAFDHAAPMLLNNQDFLDEPVGTDRFRSHLVVEGLGPYGEDDIKSVSSGVA